MRGHRKERNRIKKNQVNPFNLEKSIKVCRDMKDRKRVYFVMEAIPENKTIFNEKYGIVGH